MEIQPWIEFQFYVKVVRYLDYNTNSWRFCYFLGIESKLFAFTDALLYTISKAGLRGDGE